MNKPILIKAGDKTVLLNGVAPLVDCRVVSEELYQCITDALIETQAQLNIGLIEVGPIPTGVLLEWRAKVNQALLKAGYTEQQTGESDE